MLQDPRSLEALNDHSGDRMTVFFLNADASPQSFNTFNKPLIDRLCLPDDLRLPCIVFFAVNAKEARMIKIYRLQPDYHTILFDICQGIDAYLSVLDKSNRNVAVSFADFPEEAEARGFLGRMMRPDYEPPRS